MNKHCGMLDLIDLLGSLSNPCIARGQVSESRLHRNGCECYDYSAVSLVGAAGGGEERGNAWQCRNCLGDV